MNEAWKEKDFFFPKNARETVIFPKWFQHIWIQNQNHMIGLYKRRQSAKKTSQK